METLGFAITLALIIVISALNREREQRQEKTRRNADLIRRRLEDTQQVLYRKVEIRLGNRS